MGSAAESAHNAASNKHQLPDFFKPVLWSYTFDAIDTEKHKKAIVVNALNYGELKHWQWIVRAYGKEGVREVLRTVPKTALRDHVVPLVSLAFNISHDEFAPTPRRAH